MKETIFILLFIIPGMITITAQNDYIVKTFQQTDSKSGLLKVIFR